VPKFRLRYHATDMELPVGDFFIGRSSSCGLALDDGLVSRRHAVLHVSRERVDLEDLGSRNGVSVNGDKVNGIRALRHLDRITIGSQELVLFEIASRDSDARKTTEMRICPSCGNLLNASDEACPSCGTQSPDATRAIAGKIDADGTMSADRPASSFLLIKGIAEKGMALGRFEETEKMLATHLDALLRRVQGGDAPPVEQLRVAADLALRLAEGLKSSRWMGWVLQLYTAAGQLMDGEVLDRLHELVRKVGYSELTPVRSYLEAMRQRSDRFSAAEKFLLKRLEALDRVIASR